MGFYRQDICHTIKLFSISIMIFFLLRHCIQQPLYNHAAEKLSRKENMSREKQIMQCLCA